MTTNTTLAVDVLLQADSIKTTVTDRRPDVITTLVPLTEAQRQGFVSDAWTIGVRAIMNAHRNAEEARLADVGKSILEDVDRELHAYVVRQQDVMVQMLKRYFDPKDGQVAVRIEGFIKDGGELARTMEKYLSPEHGALARTLAKQLGENSPLLKKLSPTDNEGIVHVLEGRMRQALEQNQLAVTKALDPLAQDGAVARFLATLRKDMEKADNDRTKQLTLVTKALDANDEASLLSRLVRETQAARVQFVSSMNPDDPSSPLALLKASLVQLLQVHAKSQQDALAAFQERQAKLDLNIREALARMEERKRGDAKSIRGGFQFQDAVLRFIQRAVSGAPVAVDITANSVGTRSNCKVGDQVLRFTPESAHAGAAVVVEAKRDAYSVTKALEELDIARSNRNAAASILVMSRSHAPAGFPTFARYGVSILVVWDEADETTDAYLHAAVLLGLALASIESRPVDTGEIEALADVEHRITLELNRMEKMRKHADSIRKDAEAIGEELRKSTKGLGVLLGKAKATLKALNVQLAPANDTTSPVALPESSLMDARTALAIDESGAAAE